MKEKEKKRKRKRKKREKNRERKVRAKRESLQKIIIIIANGTRLEADERVLGSSLPLQQQFITRNRKIPPATRNEIQYMSAFFLFQSLNHHKAETASFFCFSTSLSSLFIFIPWWDATLSRPPIAAATQQTLMDTALGEEVEEHKRMSSEKEEIVMEAGSSNNNRCQRHNRKMGLMWMSW